MESDLMEEENKKMKNKIKNEIITKINDILIENKIPEIDNLTVINLNKEVAYLGNIPIFDYNLLESIEKQLSKLFNNYGSYSIRNEEVVSCCKPPYKNISFKVNVNL